MEVTVGEKGRITLPLKLRKALGILEGETLLIESRGNEIVLKPKRHVTVREIEGIAKIGRVKLEEIEESPGYE